VIVCFAVSNPIVASLDSAATVKSNDCAVYPAGTATVHVNPSGEATGGTSASPVDHDGTELPPFDGVFTTENEPVCPG